jgi:hypothetical protein
MFHTLKQHICCYSDEKRENSTGSTIGVNGRKTAPNVIAVECLFGFSIYM